MRSYLVRVNRVVGKHNEVYRKSDTRDGTGSEMLIRGDMAEHACVDGGEGDVTLGTVAGPRPLIAHGYIMLRFPRPARPSLHSLHLLVLWRKELASLVRPFVSLQR